MREKFKHFCDTANPDLLRLVIIFVLVGLLLVGFLLFGRSDEGASILPAWVQTEHVEPPDERLTVAQKENPDTVAWITIPGTNIDAPVQQYGDNDYYLRRDEKGAEDYRLPYGQQRKSFSQSDFLRPHLYRRRLYQWV